MPANATDAVETDIGPHARVYRVLGEQFLEPPDPDRVAAVEAWASEWRCNAPSLPADIEAALDRIAHGATAPEETLATAYTHLFRGISERTSPAPPYESLYADGQLYGETTTTIRQGYRWAGVDVDTTRSNEPPDHLGIELQFLAELVETTGSDPGTDDPSLEDAIWWLLDEHLTNWLPVLHDRIDAEDPPDYYGGLLDLIEAVLTHHHGALAPVIH